MKAITIWQPFCSMIAAGVKPYEFRKWRADSFVGHRIVIHASVRKVDAEEIWAMAARLREGKEGYGLKRGEALAFLERLKARLLAREPLDLPQGAGLGTALLGVPRRVKDLWDESVDLKGVSEYLYAWPIEDFKAFATPIKCMGAQGLWTWPETVSAPPEPAASYRPGVE